MGTIIVLDTDQTVLEMLIAALETDNFEVYPLPSRKNGASASKPYEVARPLASLQQISLNEIQVHFLLTKVCKSVWNKPGKS